MAERTIQNLERELARCRRTIAALERDAETCQNRGQPGQVLEAALMTMLEAATDPVAAISMDFRVIFSNDAFRKLFLQLYGHELQSRDDVRNYMTAERKAFWRDINKTALDSGTCRVVLQYSLQETRYDIEWSCTRIMDREGRAVGVALFGRNITSRRMAEETLREREAQLYHAQRSEAVGSLVGGVAHEFSNALSIVLGSLELCMADIQVDNPARVYIDDAKSGILRARKLVRQLLDFSRKSDGQRLKVNVHTLTDRALSLLRAAIPSHIEFHRHIETCPPVMADPSHIHQLIINLCTQAAQAMDKEGGVLTVTLEHITLKAGRVPRHIPLVPGKYAKLTVAHTGRGTDAVPFGQISGSTAETIGAEQVEGLALAVVRDIVKDYGGCILAQAKRGRGGKIEVYLPTASEVEPRPIPVSDAADLRGAESILLVDDEPKFVILTQRHLESLGYKVEIFTDPLKALERFKAGPGQFDLIITDAAMPKMTGENLIKQVRLLRPAIPIILCTGYSEKVSQESAVLLGCEYLVKPFETEQLSSLVRTTLDRKSG